MKIQKNETDEFLAEGLVFGANVYLIGTGAAECKPYKIKKNDKKINPVMLSAFLRKLKRKMKKYGISTLFAEEDSKENICEALDLCKCTHYDHSDYLMKYTGKTEASVGFEIITETPDSDDTDSEQKDAIFVKSRKKNEFSARVMPYLDGVYICEVLVDENKRHTGLGTGYMKSLMKAYSDVPVYLHVPSTNVPAVGLYKKLGFSADTELKYYLVS